MLRYWPTTDLREKTKCTSRALRGGHYKDLTETPKSHFYCSSVWHLCGARDADKLKALNKRILRFILGNYSSPYTTLLSKVNSTSLCNKRVQNFLIFSLIWRIRFHPVPLPMIFAATTFFNLVNLKQLPYLYADSFCLYILVLKIANNIFFYVFINYYHFIFIHNVFKVLLSGVSSKILARYLL